MGNALVSESEWTPYRVAQLRGAGHLLWNAMMARLQGFGPGPDLDWHDAAERWIAVEHGDHWCPSCGGWDSDCTEVDGPLAEAIADLECPHNHSFRHCPEGCEIPKPEEADRG